MPRKMNPFHSYLDHIEAAPLDTVKMELEVIQRTLRKREDDSERAATFAEAAARRKAKGGKRTVSEATRQKMRDSQAKRRQALATPPANEAIPLGQPAKRTHHRRVKPAAEPTAIEAPVNGAPLPEQDETDAVVAEG